VLGQHFKFKISR